MPENKIPYEPMSPYLPDRKVGKLMVRGNNSLATVMKKGLVEQAIHICDNDTDDTSQDPSAFNRAIKWAESNQDKA